MLDPWLRSTGNFLSQNGGGYRFQAMWGVKRCQGRDSRNLIFYTLVLLQIHEPALYTKFTKFMLVLQANSQNPSLALLFISSSLSGEHTNLPHLFLRQNCSNNTEACEFGECTLQEETAFTTSDLCCDNLSQIHLQAIKIATWWL